MTTTAGEARRWPWRPVLWLGLALGTFVTVTVLVNGARPRLTSLPFGFPLVLGALAEWAAMIALGCVAVAVAIALAGWLADHRRILWHGGQRAGAAAFRAGRTRGGAAYGVAHGWAASRWGRRFGDDEDFPAAELDGDDQADDVAGWLRAPMPDPRLCDAQRERDANGQGNICAACGHPGTKDDPLVIDADDGYRVHASHAERLAGLPPGAPVPAAAPAAAAIEQDGDTTMPTTTTTTAAAGWKGLAADVADFDPADDGELLAWMAEQVAGMLGYGEALTDVHEHCVSAVRLDPAAMAALHDVADAVADAAGAMAKAIDKFKQVYEGPREFVADGGVLPRSGDFITGED